MMATDSLVLDDFEQASGVAEILVAAPVRLMDGCVVNPAFVDQIEWSILKSLSSTWVEPEHYFGQGIYARMTRIRRGSFLSTRIHKVERLVALLQGDLSVWSKADGLQRTKAPYVVLSAPLTRTAVYAHEDSAVLCVHSTREIDLEKIEDEMFYTVRESRKAG